MTWSWREMESITIGDEVVVASEIKFKGGSKILTGRMVGPVDAVETEDGVMTIKGILTDANWAPMFSSTPTINAWIGNASNPMGENLEKNSENIFSNSIYWDGEAERHRLMDEWCREVSESD